MQKDGYTHGFHKTASVDGLAIEGAYTHIAPNWGKDSKLDYLNGSGCQAVIYFKKNGAFDDKGIFSSTVGGCENCNCNGGTGKYQIENFNLLRQLGGMGLPFNALFVNDSIVGIKSGIITDTASLDNYAQCVQQQL